MYFPTSVFDSLLFPACVLLPTVEFIIQAARELMQMAVSLKRYVLEVENWIEAATIVLTCVILFHNNGDDENDNEDDLRRHLAAIVIVLSWAELITLVGKHPKLTRYNIYVVMFYKVCLSYLFIDAKYRSDRSLVGI